jgi:sugar phosphate isomerase/epimerase
MLKVSPATMTTAACLAVVWLTPIGHAAETATQTAPADDGSTGWTLTVPAYSVLNRVMFFAAIDKAKVLGLKSVEGRPYRISEETGDAQLDASAPDEVLAKCRKKLADAGLQLTSYYAGNCGKDEAAMRRLFEFGRKMGIQTFVAEPRPQALATLDKLAQEFGINVAIHNHPRRPQNPKYTNWDPDRVMRMIETYSRRIGCCADTGHWVRSGLDPVECLRKYRGRLICLHLKDVSAKGPQGRDVVFGTGVADMQAMLAELHRQKFTGQLTFENEADVPDRTPDVVKSIGFVKKAAAELKQKEE